MSNIAKAVSLFAEMRAALKDDIAAAKDGVGKLEKDKDQTEAEFKAEQRKQNAQIDMMEFQGMMQLEQQLISTGSQIVSAEGRTADGIIQKIGG